MNSKNVKWIYAAICAAIVVVLIAIGFAVAHKKNLRAESAAEDTQTAVQADAQAAFAQTEQAFEAQEQATEEAPQAEQTPDVPQTEAEEPEAEEPETIAPETKAPITKAPATKAPVTKAPVTKAPVTKAPETKAPSNANQTVAAAQQYTVTLAKSDGIVSVSGGGTFEPGTLVTVSCQVQYGRQFARWASSDILSVPDGKTQNYTFTMPKKDVKLTAQIVNTFTLTVKAGEGISYVSGGGNHKFGTTVSVSCTPKTGYTFSKWVSSKPEYLSDSTSKYYSFKMPYASVTLTAKATGTQYTVTVAKVNGITSVSGGGTYAPGSKVTVSCKVQSDLRFARWASSDTNAVADGKTETYTFTMPQKDIKLTAQIINTFTLTVKAGDGIASVTGGGKYKYGTSVSVGCTVKTGYAFSKWVSSKPEYLSGSSTKSYSFTMPYASVTLTAKAVGTQYTVTLEKVDGIASVSGGGTFAPGASVTVSCQVQSGFRFSRWASSDTSAVPDGSTETYTFTMPDKNIKLRAQVYNTFTLTVNAGEGIESVTGGGKYKYGTSVMVSCTPKTGYAFSGWSSNKPEYLSGSSTMNYSFTMPYTSVTLTAKAKSTQYTVTVSADSGISYVSGDSSHAPGENVTLSARTKDGYDFAGWVRNGSIVSMSETYSFQMPDNNVSVKATSTYSTTRRPTTNEYVPNEDDNGFNSGLFG